MINNAIRNAIENALFNCTNRERQFAAEYIELNPDDKQRRNRDADLVILGIMSMYHEIKRQLGEEQREEQTMKITFLNFYGYTSVIVSDTYDKYDIEAMWDEYKQEHSDCDGDDFLSILPDDCKVYVRDSWNTMYIDDQGGKTMAKLLLRLLGAAIGSAPYVAALWMLLNGYGY